MDTFTSRMLLELLYLCVADTDICRFVYNMESPTYQHARYSDWFHEYANEQKFIVERLSKVNPTMNHLYSKRLDCLEQIFTLFERFNEKCRGFDKENVENMKAKADGFKGTEKMYMGYDNSEVIRHWPPRFIVGKQMKK